MGTEDELTEDSGVESDSAEDEFLEDHDECDTEEEDHVRSKRHSRKDAGPHEVLTCQVADCGRLLGANDPKYFKVCRFHATQPSLVVRGRCVRFCQQCGRFQDVDAFQDDRKSCRTSLLKHNARRRSRQSAAAGAPPARKRQRGNAPAPASSSEGTQGSESPPPKKAQKPAAGAAAQPRVPASSGGTPPSRQPAAAVDLPLPAAQQQPSMSALEVPAVLASDVPQQLGVWQEQRRQRRRQEQQAQQQSQQQQQQQVQSLPPSPPPKQAGPKPKLGLGSVPELPQEVWQVPMTGLQAAPAWDPFGGAATQHPALAQLLKMRQPPPPPPPLQQQQQAPQVQQPLPIHHHQQQQPYQYQQQQQQQQYQHYQQLSQQQAAAPRPAFGGMPAQLPLAAALGSFSGQGGSSQSWQSSFAGMVCSSAPVSSQGLHLVGTAQQAAAQAGLDGTVGAAALPEPGTRLQPYSNSAALPDLAFGGPPIASMVPPLSTAAVASAAGAGSAQHSQRGASAPGAAGGSAGTAAGQHPVLGGLAPAAATLPPQASANPACAQQVDLEAVSLHLFGVPPPMLAPHVREKIIQLMADDPAYFNGLLSKAATSTEAGSAEADVGK